MRRTITMFFIVLLISFNLGVLATDHVYIRASKEPSTRPSPNVNVPNPDLPNLSVHGKKVEEELASSLRINPNYQQRHVAGDRVFSTWWGYGHGEKERNLQQIAMNDYTNEIKAHQKSKNSMIGKLKSKLPNLKTKQKERERELNEKYNNAKQEREKARQSMRDIANDANVHKKAVWSVDKTQSHQSSPQKDHSSNQSPVRFHGLSYTGKKLDKPYASKNSPRERPIHANEITPNLPGLSETGKRIEEKLQDRLVKGDLHPRTVGEGRVWELWHTKSSAEHQRNDRHISVLHLKNEIRQESQTIAGRVRLRLRGVRNLKEQNAKEKQQFRQTMRDVEHDTDIHKKARTIGEKDAHYIKKPIWLDSKTLGYGSDGGSKGSSHGYRSKSASSVKLNEPFPERNKPHERPLHANEITPNLPGLTENGKRIERDLQERVKKGKLHPSQVGEARVKDMWYDKGNAEHRRNTRHKHVLNFKNEIRQGSKTLHGIIGLKLKRTKKLKEESSIEKNQFRQTLRDIAHDTNVHKKLHTIREKDARYINKPIWSASKTLGYGSDGGSKGSSYGYRSRSPSPSSSVEIIPRPKRYPPHSPESDSSSSSIPSLSSTKYSIHSPTPSLNSDASNKPSSSSTATSKRKRQ
ncbi:hypothetical protein L7F22_019304 [Adiantum nelumboides]|nr:hypothetical protein [Adiantum nelumboides]